MHRRNCSVHRLIGKLEIYLSIDGIFTNRSVEFELMDATSGDSVEGAWRGIASPYSVPSDGAVIRSDGRYTVPRLAPDLPIVRIEARTRAAGLKRIRGGEPRLAAGRDAKAGR